MRYRGTDRASGPWVDQSRGPRPLLNAASRSVTAIGVGHRAVLGLLTLLGSASHRRIPALCQCQGVDDSSPGAEGRLLRFRSGHAQRSNDSHMGPGLER